MRVFCLLVLLMSLVLPTSHVEAQGLAVKGDARAWEEIQAAFMKLFRLKSYRMRVTGADGSSVTISYEGSGKSHIVMSQGGTTFESIRVGNETRIRQGGGQWTCPPAGAPTPQIGGQVPTDPSKISGEVTASKGPVAAVDGIQTQSYMYALVSGGSTSRFRLFVAIASGLPRRMHMLDERGNATSTIDYFDYDVPVITLPSCS